MGLDIYLYAREQAEQSDRYSEATKALYGRADYDSLTEQQKDEARRALPEYARHEDVPSQRYPDYLFNRRYLRSSYNPGGFNHAVPQFLCTAANNYPNERGSLYWIFEPLGREWDGDAGDLTADDLPALRECKKRAEEVAGELRTCDPLRTLTAGPNIFGKAPTLTDDQALALYREKLVAGRISPDGWWSNAEMDVFGDGITVLAAIPGKGTFGEPAVHLIYRATGDGFDSYVQSAEITAEFCDEAIALVERDGGARLSWSG
jgi:hypothetical protein